MESHCEFDRCNIYEAIAISTQAHEGAGYLSFARLATRAKLSGACNFIDFTRMPPGSSIGLHTHGSNEEEFYLILEGEGEMSRDGESFAVRAGDLVRNRPGGSHSLANTGLAELKLFVFEIATL